VNIAALPLLTTHNMHAHSSLHTETMVVQSRDSKDDREA